MASVNKERHILFSAEMVRAILDGRKIQTRRVIKPIGKDDGFVLLDNGNGWWPYRSDDGESEFRLVKERGKFYYIETPHDCPYGEIGDRLWVKEAFEYNGESYIYAADLNELGVTKWAAKWKPSIHMPRAASRILLEITNIRVEQLQDISEADAMSEGISRVPFRPDDGFPICDGFMVGKDDGVSGLFASAIAVYKNLWESIYGKDSWDLNPWVWVIEFKRIQDDSISQ